MRLLIQVTQRDLDYSVRNSPHYNAVLCALRHRMYSKHLVVNHGVLRVEDNGFICVLPPHVQEYMKRYDKHEVTTPSNFFIQLPAYLVKPDIQKIG
jgi:hypothetical protein